MQTVLFLFKSKNERVDYLKNILLKEYFVIDTNSYEETVNILDKMSYLTEVY